MPKRKSDTEYLLKKLRRLERKIKKQADTETPDEEDIIVTEDYEPALPAEDPPLTENPPPEESPPPATTQTDSIGQDPLDESIIKVLGKSYDKPPEMGKKIHASIAERWENIIQNGLEKEEKDTILKNPFFLPPENCPHLIVPKMNPETLAACVEANKKRDNLIEARQKVLSKCISGLAYATEKIIKEVNPQELKLNLLEIMNSTGKLLADTYCNETRNRRSLVVSGLDKEMRDTLLQTKSDKFLFGEDLYEKIKTAKSVGKTGREIRTQPKSKPNTSKGSLNWKGPPRQTQKPLPQDSRVIKNRNGGPRQAPLKRAPPAAARTSRKQISSNNSHTLRS